MPPRRLPSLGLQVPTACLLCGGIANTDPARSFRRVLRHDRVAAKQEARGNSGHVQEADQILPGTAVHRGPVYLAAAHGGTCTLCRQPRICFQPEVEGGTAALGMG